MKSFKIPKPKGVIRIRKSKDGHVQHNRTNNELQNIHIKLKTVAQTPLKAGTKLGCLGKVSCSCSTSGTRHVNLITNPVIGHE
jgi:hypothetical protein